MPRVHAQSRRGPGRTCRRISVDFGREDLLPVMSFALAIYISLPVHDRLAVKDFARLIRTVHFDERGWRLDEAAAIRQSGEHLNPRSRGAPTPQLLSIADVKGDQDGAARSKTSIVLPQGPFHPPMAHRPWAAEVCRRHC